MSVTFRLSLTYLLITFAGLLLLGGGFVVLAGRYVANQRDQALAAQAEIYAALLGELADSPTALQALASSGVGRELLPTDTDVRLFATNGLQLAGNPDLGPFPSRAVLALVQPIVPLPASQAADRRYAAQTIRVGRQPIGVVELSLSTAEDLRLFHTLRALTIQVTLVASLVMTLVSLVVARSLAQPILHQSQRAEQLAHTFEPAPLQPRSQRDEIKRLGASLDALEASLHTYTARISELEEARTRFYRSVSHDLRTPLTAISGMIENLSDTAPVAQQPTLAMIDTETQRLTRLVDELLRPPSDGRLLVHRPTTIALAPFAHEVVNLLAGRAQRAGIELGCHVEREIAISGDRDRLKQALLNLLDNALRVTPPGGSVDLHVSAMGNYVRLSVSDSGPGIAPSFRATMWEHGLRGDNPGSSGIGLAIVREVAESHGGRAFLDETFAPGASLVLELPIERNFI